MCDWMYIIRQLGSQQNEHFTLTYNIIFSTDPESTLSPLESAHKFESLLRPIWDADNRRCEQPDITGEKSLCTTVLLFRALFCFL